MNLSNSHHENQDLKEDSKQAVTSKKDNEASNVVTCEKCTKLFMNEPAYQTHLKTKHSQPQKSLKQQSHQLEPNQESQPEKPQEKKPPKRSIHKNRMLQIQQNQLEDTIYAFLGELGEKNAEPANNRSQFVLQNESQRLTGQTNYSLNKVVRTPYEQPIKASQCLPNEEIEKSPHRGFLQIVKAEIKQLEDKVEAEREIWQLRDPMAPEQQTQDEFSLMDIRKLIINYPKRKLNLKYPNFSIFLLWVARICKPPAFREFFMILGAYLSKFIESLQGKKLREQTCYQQWKSYYKSNENKIIEKEVVERMEICDEKNCRKLIEYFVDWTDKFRALVL